MPAVRHGVETNGVDEVRRKEIRADIMRAIGTGNQGASATMTMRMANVEFEYNVTALPLEKWHQQIWNAMYSTNRKCVSLKDLRSLWRTAMKK